MEYFNLICESTIVSIAVNSVHISFEKGMVLNWLFNLLERIFRKHYSYTDLLKGVKGLMVMEKENVKVLISESEEYDITTQCYIQKLQPFPINEHTKIAYKSDFRNKEGLSYIGKAIYKCAPCMGFWWSIPLILNHSISETFSIGVMSIFLSKLFKKLI